MARIFVLDSDPAGLACHQSGNQDAVEFRAWMFGQRDTSTILAIPEIIDFEVRRALILAGAKDSVRRLDSLYSSGIIQLLPITTGSMRMAADLWAEARRKHRPTAGGREIDGDVILAAQSLGFCSEADDWMILTENVNHIERYVGDKARSRRATIAEWLKLPKSSLPRRD